MKTNQTILISLILLFGLSVIFLGLKSNSPTGQVNLLQDEKVTLYKSQRCSCCVNYVPYLEREGLKVEVKSMVDTDPIKQEHNIPHNMQSCHTTIIGDYFVEGHVPIKAIEKLMAEKPDIDGITLPDMPSGSPGMPGVKTEAFKIYALSNGIVSEFMTI